MNNNVMDIMAWKYPGFLWQCEDTYDSLEWRDPSPKPTLADIQQADIDYSAYLASTLYARERAVAYPSIVDQIDMLWHGIDTYGSVTKDSDFYIQRKAVKDKYPKG